MSDHWDLDQLITERDAALAALRRVGELCDHADEDDNYWGDYLTFAGAVRAVVAPYIDAE